MKYKDKRTTELGSVQRLHEKNRTKSSSEPNFIRLI